MNKKIILVGCGNIGSRHLQGIVKLNKKLSIEIVEPNIKSQRLAKSRLCEIKYNKDNHKISWYTSLHQINNKSDLVIVATNSDIRVNLIQQILELGHKRFIIEKIVCQSTKEYSKLLHLMKKHNAKGWVNTNRRYFKTYQKIKETFKSSKFLHVSVFSGGSGLGTNAIHYLDLFSWLVDDYEIKLNGEFLDKKIYKNKRGNKFKEFLGTIIGFNKNGSFVSLTFFPSKHESFLVNIYGENKAVSINELEEKAYFIINGIKKNTNFRYNHISHLTTKIVQDILNTDDCFLPTLSDSYRIHKELFNIFNHHIKKLLNKKVTLCPIT